ncbi:MAG TPA: baseplate J/gp47 family protein [Sphingomonas sp.]|nr:baseplate J/gp47 family protein [Sphingomonas sp.]
MAVLSTTVDLSRLPAPVFVPQLAYDAIVAQMVADVQAVLPSFDATVDSDPAVKVLQVAAYREMLLRRQHQEAAEQNLVAYATGARLDHLGALVGVTRLTVTPADPATGAAAVLEGDDAFRQRIVLAPEGFSCAGPELAYVAHAKAASGDVLDASATSPAPGQVRVSILSRIGNGAAAPGLIAAVDAIVTDRAIRPLGDQVVTASADIVNFAVAAQLVTFAGPDIEIVLNAARAALAAYLADNRRLGRTITRSGLIAALSVAGVHRVDLTAPLADVACDATQAAWCIGVAVAHGGFAS